MDLAALRDYLGAKPGAMEDLPFGPEVLVLKVAGKMFALVAWQDLPLTISLKADPQQALLWRELYPAVSAGYHLNKQHWNTVTLDGSLSDELLRTMIDESWQRVVAGLKKSERLALLGPGSTTR
jgi:predicted DNA-binding protein (MmcQ/YjbR family)